MATLTILKNRGLFLGANQFSSIPEGAHATARNVITPFRDILESRRGQKFLPYSLGISTDRSNIGVFYKDTLIIQYGASTLAHYTGAAFTAFSGSYTPPDAALLRMKFFEATENLYFTTSGGIYYLETTTDTPIKAGVAKPTAAYVATWDETGDAMPGSCQATHRFVWCYEDANGNIKTSPPSSRYVHKNSNFPVAIGGVVRAANVTTVTVAGLSLPASGGALAVSRTLQVGDFVTLTPGEAGFPAGTFVVTATAGATFSYADPGVNGASALVQGYKLNPRAALVSVFVPPEARGNARYFFRHYRSDYSASESTAPDDECHQVYESKIPTTTKTCAIGNAAKVASSVATVTIAAHGFYPGQYVTITPGEVEFPASGSAGVYIIKTPTANTFTYDTGVVNTVTNSVAQTFGYGQNYLFRDVCPQAIAKNPLYTNENTGDGIGAAKERPPIAKDVCYTKNRAWYVNTTDKHRFNLTIVGVGPTDGIQVADTITINGRSYGANGGGDVPFFITTALTPTQNIEYAANDLVSRINADTNAGSQSVYAYYVSAANGAPGQILIEEAGIGGAGFSVYASRPSSWNPVLTTGATGALVSKNDRRKNGISYSIRGEPEAVPLLNYLTAGPKNRELIRAVPLRDKIFLFSEDGKIYTISGEFPFTVDEFDGTAKLIAPDTAAVHNNQIHALTTQGAVAVSDAGVRITGMPIEPDIDLAFGSYIDNLKRRAFGFSYESDRQYQLWLPSNSTDTCCTQGYIYNSLLDTWVQWTGNRTWGAVDKTANLLYMGDGGQNKVRVERKTYTRDDYSDESVSVNITAVSGQTITLTMVEGFAAGDMLWQSGSLKSLITAVDNSALTVMVATAESWVIGAAEVRIAIDCKAKWVTCAPQGPAALKRFRDATLHFRSFYVNAFSMVFDSDNSTTEVGVDMTAPGFGLVSFGDFLFGQEVGQKNRRGGVPIEHMEGAELRVGFAVREANSIWTVYGYSVEWEYVGERNSQ